MKTLTFTYKNLLWESVELALRKHRLTRANIKRYGWKEAPEIELTEVVLTAHKNVRKKSGKSWARLSPGESYYNITVKQSVSN